MRRLALRSAFSAKAAAEQIVVLDQLAFEAPKTIEFLQLLDNLELDGSVVILLPERNDNVEKSVRNLPDVKAIRANYLNIRDLLGHNHVIVTKDAVSTIESFLGQ